MAKVRVGLEYKRNMQNFENCTVRIEIEDESSGSEKVDDLFRRVYSKVESYLLEKVTEIETEISHTEDEVRRRKKERSGQKQK